VETQRVQVGKLPAEFLQALLERYGGSDERLIVGPRIGEDAAVVDMGDRYLVAKSDPITFATDEIGWYVVHVNANDVATMGAAPRWLLLTLLLPEARTDRQLVEAIFAQTGQACRELGIVLCGGHTEVTYGLDRPLAVGLMLGEVAKEDLVCSAGSQAGDDVILTKGIAIEGTAVLARELGEQVAPQLGADLVARSRRFLRVPGISVVQEAQILCRVGRPPGDRPMGAGLGGGQEAGDRSLADPRLSRDGGFLPGTRAGPAGPGRFGRSVGNCGSRGFGPDGRCPARGRYPGGCHRPGGGGAG